MFYTTKELADLLRLHPSTLKRMADEGSLPKPVVIGSTSRWNKEVIDEFLSNKKE